MVNLGRGQEMEYKCEKVRNGCLASSDNVSRSDPVALAHLTSVDMMQLNCFRTQRWYSCVSPLFSPFLYIATIWDAMSTPDNAIEPNLPSR